MYPLACSCSATRTRASPACYHCFRESTHLIEISQEGINSGCVCLTCHRTVTRIWPDLFDST